MRIQFETQPDRRQLTAVLRHTMRPVARPLRYGAPFALLIAALRALDSEWVMVVTFALLALFLWVLPTILVRLALRTNWRLHQYPVTWEVTDDGFRSRNELTDSSVKWAAVSRVDVMPGHLLLKLNRHQAIPMPTSTLAADDLRDLTGLLRQRGLLRQPDSELAMLGTAA